MTANSENLTVDDKSLVLLGRHTLNTSHFKPHAEKHSPKRCFENNVQVIRLML